MITPIVFERNHPRQFALGFYVLGPNESYEAWEIVIGFGFWAFGIRWRP